MPFVIDVEASSSRTVSASFADDFGADGTGGHGLIERVAGLHIALRLSLCRLSEFLWPPVAQERPSARQLEIAPPIDRQDNLRQRGGWQVLALAG